MISLTASACARAGVAIEVIGERVDTLGELGRGRARQRATPTLALDHEGAGDLTR